MNIWLHTYTLDVPFFLKNVRHTGIEVFGSEYTFSMDGITTCKPKKSTIGKYSKSYELTYIKLTYSQFSEILNALGKIYRPNTYNFIYKNCNHFCDDLFELLSGKRLFHTFMIYSRLGKLFGNFKNVALCGYINSMELSRNDKTLYIYALRLSKSILHKNRNIKNNESMLYINDLGDDYFNNCDSAPLYIVPYSTYTNNSCMRQPIYYNENLLNNSIKGLRDEMRNHFFQNGQFRTLCSLSTRGSISLA
ncbi:PPPDE peptidase, putative [Plasmodium ovale wallikeri]|uniref:PPPDE peptidase, putative n=2 Tax=Plasmodium ovale TaxID=36330 RepID=A0A1A8YPZ0_PLAOA|nr:PPPDE peptidase, putative [Plasmodium ovale wallikeri]SBT33929.1 PPPDE peptidase, putative [Plasmodium ovale wallikeri]SBT76385.1 PPPDE peptidase, putative [Plasmodium ovale]